MERKYYLRGLGLGIAVTAVIMGMAKPDNRVMTNDEIIARAKELGMVENTVLANTDDTDGSQENTDDDRSDVRNEADQSQKDLAAAEAEGENGPEADNAGQESIHPENASDEENPESEDVNGEEEQNNTTVREENNTGTDNPNGVSTSTAVRVITIKSGDSSYTVAKKLADAGVVASAQDFDTFLCQNGYDKRLVTGSFSIPSDASDEQIARIVTGAE